VHAGDTLLILDNREYLIKVKDAEAALMDAKGAKDVLSSSADIERSYILVYYGIIGDFVMDVFPEIIDCP